MTGTLVRADGHPVVLVPNGEYFARLHYRLRHRLPMWVISRPGTREYPYHWSARMHVALPDPRPSRFVMTHDTRQGLRDMLPPNLTFMRRSNDDAPKIEEIWL